MTKTEFKEIDKENEYISNLLRTHQKGIQKKLDVFFETLGNAIKEHGFIHCIHTHYFPSRVSVYDGTEKESHNLIIQNFEIINQSSSFPPVVMKIIKEWLRGVEA